MSCPYPARRHRRFQKLSNLGPGRVVYNYLVDRLHLGLSHLVMARDVPDHIARQKHIAVHNVQVAEPAFRERSSDVTPQSSGSEQGRPDGP